MDTRMHASGQSFSLPQRRYPIEQIRRGWISVGSAQYTQWPANAGNLSTAAHPLFGGIGCDHHDRSSLYRYRY